MGAQTESPILQRMMGDVLRGEMRAINVRFKDVYGVQKCYPACAQAERFAAIAGTKTLSPQVLKLIMSIGFMVVPQDMSVEMLDAFLRGV